MLHECPDSGPDEGKNAALAGPFHACRHRRFLSSKAPRIPSPPLRPRRARRRAGAVGKTRWKISLGTASRNDALKQVRRLADEHDAIIAEARAPKIDPLETLSPQQRQVIDDAGGVSGYLAWLNARALESGQMQIEADQLRQWAAEKPRCPTEAASVTDVVGVWQHISQLMTVVALKQRGAEADVITGRPRLHSVPPPHTHAELCTTAAINSAVSMQGQIRSAAAATLLA